VSKPEKLLGLIINPIAGLGGRVGLKGSDGIEVQREAIRLGAEPQTFVRTIQALEMLSSLLDDLELVTYPGEMGESAAQAAQFKPVVIGSIIPGATTPGDTINAAIEMERLGVSLILFTGGDGTARDIYKAIADRIPVVGIPAGVKMHSGVFGINPRQSGTLAGLYLEGKARRLREVEVMDIDEDGVREGWVSARLYGYLKVPYRSNLLQSSKSGSHPGEGESLQAIACDVIENMLGNQLYFLGPGTTTRAITDQLGFGKTLLGVDVITKDRFIARDVNESQLLGFMIDQSASVIVTPIGGQGFLFGRGNQQISPQVLRRLGESSEQVKANLIVISTLDKIHRLEGRPFLVDTGDQELDLQLSGYFRVTTGYHEHIIYRVTT